MDLKDKSEKKSGKRPINMSKLLSNLSQVNANNNYIEIQPHPSK
jgi:hypothetical protein